MALEARSAGAAKLAVLVAIVSLASGVLVAPAQAADLDVIGAEPIIEGVPCNSLQARAFPSVWRGHFTGGESSYSGPGGKIALDWQDVTLCFQTRRACGTFIAEMRQAYHRPEGYFTCLPIR